MVAFPRVAGALARLAASRAGRRAAARYGLDEGDQSQSLDSSAIRHASYSMDGRTLSITFLRSGRTYTYYGVAPGVYLNLVNAPSAGRYFNFNIRNRYSFT